MSALVDLVSGCIERHDFEGARAALAEVFAGAGATSLEQQTRKEHLERQPAPEKVTGFMLGVMTDLAKHGQAPLTSFRLTMRLDGTECGLHGVTQHQTTPGTPLYDHGIRSDVISMSLHKAAAAFLGRRLDALDPKEAYLLLKATLYAQEATAFMGALVATPELRAWSGGPPIPVTFGAGYATGGNVEDLFRVKIVGA